MDDLVIRFKQGDVRALEYLIDEYSTPLVRFVKSYIMDGERSKDIVQEAFIALWMKRENLVEKSNLKALLYTICKNKALNTLRDEKKIRNCIEIETLFDANIKSLSCFPTDLMDDIDIENKINQLIGLLPEKYREVFLKSREEEKSYSQISKELNISQKAVEKRMSKTFSFFREHMKEQFFILFFICWVGFFILSVL